MGRSRALLIGVGDFSTLIPEGRSQGLVVGSGVELSEVFEACRRVEVDRYPSAHGPRLRSQYSESDFLDVLDR
jgi:hypothetical protein